MGLQPLEFSDCLTDSPYFREKLHTHEKEIERTSKSIKALIGECKDVLNATRVLSKAQRNFSQSLTKFKFDCIDNDQTEDEKVIECSLQEFGRLLSNIEDEREKLLDQAMNGIVQPLDGFRKEQLGAAKDGKKRFDKETSRYCQSLERYLNLNAKTADGLLQDADHCLDMEKKHFGEESMKYVLKLQEVQERKKFEFVEILLSLVYRWLTFYHTGHEVFIDFKPYLEELQLNIQRCRANFDTTREEAEQLMKKMLSVRGPKQEPTSSNKTCTREGYLYIKEKKALSTTWSKHYCQYQKENKILTIIPYNQVTSKGITTEAIIITSCTRRASDTIDKRFCFDLTVQDKAQVLTIQALSENDRKLWMDAMDGKEPIYHQPASNNDIGSLLDDIGYSFIQKCTQVLEERGLDEQGLYRVVGVGSKVNKLTIMGLDRRKCDKLDLRNEAEWETKTLTSAIKNYFRTLPEPLLTYKLHSQLIQAAKNESRTLRINEVHELIHQLPEENFNILELLIRHLKGVSSRSDVNLMTIGNLGVCFGPTLMRAKEETLASIMDIKWCNLVVEILIDNYEKIFKTAPQFADLQNTRVLNTSASVISDQSSTSTTTINSEQSSNVAVPHANPHSNTNALNSASTSTSTLASRNHVTPQQTNDFQYQSPSMTSSMTSSNSVVSSMNNSSTGSPHMYANLNDANNTNNSMSRSYDGTLTYAQYKSQLRPKGGFYSQYSGEHPSSTSSSTESLNSKCSGSSNNNTQAAEVSRRGPPAVKGHVAQAITRFSQPISTAQAPTTNNGTSRVDTGHYGNRKRQSADSLTHSISSSASSVSSMSSGHHHHHHHHHHHNVKGRKVRTLYSCEAENETELSFEPNEIILNVRQSREPGWLEGTLNGRSGLIPANYVEYIN